MKDAWPKEKLVEWRKMWESEMGQEALRKIVEAQNYCLAQAVHADSHETIVNFVGKASGIQLVLDDIQVGINKANEAEKEDKKDK